MLPLKDDVPHSIIPWFVALLLLSNVAIFFYVAFLPDAVQEATLLRYSVVPARFLQAPLSFELVTLVTSQFLHGGLLHIFSNMLALFIFGDNVEDRFGHLQFLIFYLFAGAVGGLVHIWAAPGSTIPALGASGAIAGVLASYLVMFPGARITTLIPIFIFPWIVRIPALLWLGGWFVLQLASGLEELNAIESAEGGVGYWAHIGGFVTGLVLVWFLRYGRRRR